MNNHENEKYFEIFFKMIFLGKEIIKRGNKRNDDTMRGSESLLVL